LPIEGKSPFEPPVAKIGRGEGELIASCHRPLFGGLWPQSYGCNGKGNGSEMATPLWEPSDDIIRNANVTALMAQINERHGQGLNSYEALHAFSIEHQEAFWAAIWDFGDVRASHRGDRIIADGDKMPGASYFPDARLNYAENLLRRRDDTPALIFRGEDKAASQFSWSEMHDVVSCAQQAMAAAGVSAGDRVAAMVPNMPETAMAMLATASLGGTWSSCSPDFGERGVLDRFGQIEPKILIACDGYYYNGKEIDVSEKLASVVAQLPSVEKVIVISYLGRADEVVANIQNAVTWEDFVGAHDAGEIEYAQLPFDHPLYILFSSGTTGVPKCIVHSAGGVLIKHLAEQQMQCDIKPGDRVFYFSTCGWMMWNWLMSALASEATLLLYDGSPFAPSERVLFDFADAHGATLFGTSAKFIDALKKTGWSPNETYALEKVRLVMSTGSPLAPESFDFVYSGIKDDVHLSSISGGTDICGCFVGGVALLPVWRGEIQANFLGMATDVWDDDGQHMASGKGELVCTKPFPSMPISFWNDPNGEKYHNAYFSRFDNIWCHGDFAEWTEHGGMIIHGRSDATLNPGGVRIGTAEIYAQVEPMEQVLEALAIGQDWDNDVRVVLFVRLAEGISLDEDLVAAIKKRIRAGASPRHVPAKVVAVADIPRTKSGKITELAVRDIVHGREVKNQEALANPEALDLYRNIPDLQS
jgi:acetoacetyl-CoA synthetase